MGGRWWALVGGPWWVGGLVGGCQPAPPALGLPGRPPAWLPLPHSWLLPALQPMAACATLVAAGPPACVHALRGPCRQLAHVTVGPASPHLIRWHLS